jgi:NADH dehydrogenase
MGVKVLLNTLVKNYDGHEVELVNGETINSKIVIWAAGVRGNVPEGLPVISVHKSNRLNVNANNLVSGTSNIYAIGDLALFTSDAYPNGLPQVANVAIDQASNLAKNLIAQLNNAPLLPYKYRNKGAMATVGRNKAVVDLQIPNLSFKGFFAWFIWMALHLFLLIGLKNRLVVFINWVVKYFTRNQSLSLLFSPLSRKSNQNIHIEQKPE